MRLSELIGGTIGALATAMSPQNPIPAEQNLEAVIRAKQNMSLWSRTGQRGVSLTGCELYAFG